MIGKIRQRILFTKTERYLLRHQAKPFVLHSKHQESSDTSDYELPKEFVSEQSLYLHKILKGVRHTKSKQVTVEVERDPNDSDRSNNPLQK